MMPRKKANPEAARAAATIRPHNHITATITKARATRFLQPVQHRSRHSDTLRRRSTQSTSCGIGRPASSRGVNQVASRGSGRRWSSHPPGSRPIPESIAESAFGTMRRPPRRRRTSQPASPVRHDRVSGELRSQQGLAIEFAATGAPNLVDECSDVCRRAKAAGFAAADTMRAGRRRGGGAWRG